MAAKRKTGQRGPGGAKKATRRKASAPAKPAPRTRAARAGTSRKKASKTVTSPVRRPRRSAPAGLLERERKVLPDEERLVEAAGPTARPESAPVTPPAEPSDRKWP
jgi:hypothetical protein